MKRFLVGILVCLCGLIFVWSNVFSGQKGEKPGEEGALRKIINNFNCVVSGELNGQRYVLDFVARDIWADCWEWPEKDSIMRRVYFKDTKSGVEYRANSAVRVGKFPFLLYVFGLGELINFKNQPIPASIPYFVKLVSSEWPHNRVLIEKVFFMRQSFL